MQILDIFYTINRFSCNQFYLGTYMILSSGCVLASCCIDIDWFLSKMSVFGALFLHLLRKEAGFWLLLICRYIFHPSKSKENWKTEPFLWNLNRYSLDVCSWGVWWTRRYTTSYENVKELEVLSDQRLEIRKSSFCLYLFPCFCICCSSYSINLTCIS